MPNPPVPISVSSKITAVDINQQTVQNTTQFIYHPSSLYVGIYLPQKEDRMVQKLNRSYETEFSVELIVVNRGKLAVIHYANMQDGQPVPNVPIELTVGNRKESSKIISAYGAVEYQVKCAYAGKTDVTAIVQDSQGLISSSTSVIQVSIKIKTLEFI